jgi:NAD(P)-dependent dehydrogenase (short-subunit alcohol dehydrogenase family)
MARPAAVITGASGSIGKQLCGVDLASAGYDIAAVSRSSDASPGKVLPGLIDEALALALTAVKGRA